METIGYCKDVGELVAIIEVDREYNRFKRI